MRRIRSALIAALAVMAVVLPPAVVATTPAEAASWTPISGSGSTWGQSALDLWRRDVASSMGMTVNYAGTGASAGRRDFIAGTVDFAVSELPFQANPEDGSAPESPSRGYAYVPLVAGGLSFMYNLSIDGTRVTDLRLDSATIAKIFTGAITSWDDPAIARANPGLVLPHLGITPVVRSDPAGTTNVLTQWFSKTNPDTWNAYCATLGRTVPCGPTSVYPVTNGMKAESGSLGVMGYVSQSYGAGSIGYVEDSYVARTTFPAVNLLNRAGRYIAPSPDAETAALSAARLDLDPASPTYLTGPLDEVFASTDPQAYPLSFYAYMIVPTQTGIPFTAARGLTLGTFLHYALCEGQQLSASLHEAPLPLNLARVGLAQLARIPGAGSVSTDPADCANPTFIAHDLTSAGLGLSATTIEAVDGPLSLEIDAGATAALVPAGVLNRSATSRGTLPTVRIHDRRIVSRPGWDLVMGVADFRNDADAAAVIDARNLGVRPAIVTTEATGVTASAGQSPGSASYPAPFASAAAGGSGDTALTADLTLLVPSTSRDGSYGSQLTLTLVSR